MVKFVDKAPALLGQANVQRHKTVFESSQPRYLLPTTALQEIADNEGPFLGMMYDACHQQLQAGFPLVRSMRNQSPLDDVVIILTNMCVRLLPKNEADPWDAAGELYCTVFAAVDSVGRPQILRTVGRTEEWNQPWARQHPDNKEYWPPGQSKTGRRTLV